MGFIPLDGLIKNTCSGSIDSGILFNRQSGMEGISGVSADMRQVFAASAQGNSRARLAVDVFVRRIPTLVGSMVASLGARCFGVHRWNRGNSPEIRAAVCSSCVFLDLKLKPDKNANTPGDIDVAADGSASRVLVVHTH